MPLYGLQAVMPLEELAKRLEEVTSTLKTWGIPHPDPLLTISTLTTAAIPFFRICESGYVDLKTGKIFTLRA